MDSHNIGQVTYGLFHLISEGLQGKVPQHPTKREDYPNPGFWNGFSPQQIREFYLNPRDTIQSTSWSDEQLMLFVDDWHFDEKKKDYRKKGIYCLSDIFLSREDISRSLKSHGIELPPLPGFKRAIKERIWILRGITEPQIHFYGNKDKVPANLTQEFNPLSRENLGAELAYTFDWFLEKHPRGKKGSDLGPNNSHYEINGRKGNRYDVRHAIEDGTDLFVDLTLDDVRSLTKNKLI